MILLQQTQSRLVDYFKMQLIAKHRIKIRVVDCHVVRLAVIGNLKRVSSFVCKPKANRGIGERVLQRYCAYKLVQGIMSIM